MLDLVTDDLKAKLMPASRRLKDIERERQERRKVRKRTKTVAPGAARASTDVEMADANTSAESTAGASGSTSVAAGSSATTTGADEDKGKQKAGGELEDENVYREKEAKELEALISPELQSDIGCSVTGLYELVG